MLSLDKCYDVVIIDEIQMIADSQRGSAWTAAVFGTAAEELHCGEERAVPIVQALAEITGDLVTNHDQHLLPLEVGPRSLECDLSRRKLATAAPSFMVDYRLRFVQSRQHDSMILVALSTS